MTRWKIVPLKWPSSTYWRKFATLSGGEPFATASLSTVVGGGYATLGELYDEGFIDKDDLTDAALTALAGGGQLVLADFNDVSLTEDDIVFSGAATWSALETAGLASGTSISGATRCATR